MTEEEEKGLTPSEPPIEGIKTTVESDSETLEREIERAKSLWDRAHRISQREKDESNFLETVGDSPRLGTGLTLERVRDIQDFSLGYIEKVEEKEKEEKKTKELWAKLEKSLGEGDTESREEREKKRQVSIRVEAERLIRKERAAEEAKAKAAETRVAVREEAAPPMVMPQRQPVPIARPMVRGLGMMPISQPRGDGLDRLRQAGSIMGTSKLRAVQEQGLSQLTQRLGPTRVMPTTVPTPIPTRGMTLRATEVTPELQAQFERRGYEALSPVGGKAMFWIGSKQGVEPSSNAWLVQLRTGRYGVAGIGDVTGKLRSKISYDTPEDAQMAAPEIPGMKGVR